MLWSRVFWVSAFLCLGFMASSQTREIKEMAAELIIEDIFWMMNTNEHHQEPFRDGHAITVVQPYIGLQNDTSMISHAEGLQAFVKKHFAEYTPEYFMNALDQDWLSIVEDLPDRCNPTEGGIFLKIALDGGSRPSRAELWHVKTVDEEERYVDFALRYYWDENENLILDMIDLRECGV